ncbi:hypothetical protein [Hydrogenimonas sp.]
MVRAALLSLCLALSLAAGALEEARGMLAPGTYESHARLLSLLFEKEGAYCRQGRCDAAKIAETLRENGLLTLKLPRREEVTLRFSCRGARPFLLMKLVGRALEGVGLGGLVTREAALDGEGFSWSLSYTSDRVADPVALGRELAESGVFVSTIRRLSPASWEYGLQMEGAALPVPSLERGRRREVVRPVRPVWFGVEGIKTLTIREMPGSHWYADVAVYDKMLRILSVKESDTRTRYLRIRLPEEAAYVKIGDRFTLENIRSGLKIDAR